MIAMYLKDKQLRWQLSRVARSLMSLILFVYAMVFAFTGQYDRACFYLLLAAMVAPETWMPTRKPADEVKP